MNPEPVTMPSAEEIRKALHTFDLVICAAEDQRLVGEQTIEELRGAFRALSHMHRYAR